MSKSRLLWRLFPTYVLVVVMSLAATTWYASTTFRDFHLQQTRENLEAAARLAEPLVAQRIQANQHPNLDELCANLGHRGDMRVTVILPSGLVIGDSHEPSNMMENHANRPEIQAAMAGQVGSSVRFSHTLGKNLMYVAIPHFENNRVHWVLRTSVSVSTLSDALQSLYGEIFLGGIVILLAAALISFFIVRRITRPLTDMKTVADHFARGELHHRMMFTGIEGLDALATALNNMAERLDERMKAVIRQRNEMEAILSGMVEGVLAVDANEHIITLNQSAADMASVDADWARGRTIQEVMRNKDLQNLVRDALASRNHLEIDIVLENNGDRFIQAHGTPLRDENEKAVGAIVVLNDITRMKRLENVRRDFVANVSHELRTPITSIKGFVETLQEGAIDDAAQARRFLGIIAKQVDRLNTIIEDLMDLARLEQFQESGGIELHPTRVRHPLKTAIEACSPKAAEKDIRISLTCDDDLEAWINLALIEQVIINLVDNAIKYSETGSTIEVSARQENNLVELVVQDEGCGIRREHLPRIFERFYRVDKARSRDLGGTGLGLAIVKHIAQAHRGSVHAESSFGKGSRFIVRFPMVPPEPAPTRQN